MKRFIEHQKCLLAPLLTPAAETLSDIKRERIEGDVTDRRACTTQIYTLSHNSEYTQQTITEEIHPMLMQSCCCCCWRPNNLPSFKNPTGKSSQEQSVNAGWTVCWWISPSDHLKKNLTFGSCAESLHKSCCRSLAFYLLLFFYLHL